MHTWLFYLAVFGLGLVCLVEFGVAALLLFRAVFHTPLPADPEPEGDFLEAGQASRTDARMSPPKIIFLANPKQHGSSSPVHGP
ncbi:hypothetical protein [Rhodocaloribacter sp.]